jgi:hypothetical protein
LNRALVCLMTVGFVLGFSCTRAALPPERPSPAATRPLGWPTERELQDQTAVIRSLLATQGVVQAERQLNIWRATVEYGCDVAVAFEEPDVAFIVVACPKYRLGGNTTPIRR